jgi:serine/threonine-protein kinase PknG
MTPPPYCIGQHCPGEADRDGFCRMSGLLCPAFAPDAAVPEPEPLLVSVRLEPESRQRWTTSTSRRYPMTSARPWEQPVVVSAVPARDPAESAGPEVVVPEHARRCANTSCRRAVGHHRTSGYCTHCGTPYSFRPPLAQGDLRAGRYRIERCLGHGGLGWVFLARDEQRLGAWLVLKGLRNPKDVEAAKALAAEMSALVHLNHPNIVTMTHVLPPDPGTDAVYLAMEYVNGGTLEHIRASAGPEGGPAAINADQVIEFGDKILDAFEYLHDNGWLYCDLKPENVMRAGTRLKIVDFGAVRRIDDRDSPPWGTPGFQAPEVEDLGPAGTTIRSDIYTVGRTLGALALAASTGQFLAMFPGRIEWHTVPVPPRLDPFVRLIARATAADPAARFDTAADMREQLAGVGRQVQATDEIPRPARSAHFGPFRRTFGDHADPERGLDPEDAALGLPIPLVDNADPAAGFLASIGAAEPDEVLALLDAAPERSAEVVYWAVRTHVAARHPDRAAELFDSLPDDTTQWRRHWHRGLVALAAGDARTARTCFDATYGWLPGEVSARLAYAVACELNGATAEARDHYHAVWRTDRAAESAAFGLARTLLVAPWPADGDRPVDGRDQAVAVLGQVPDSSHASTIAGVWQVRLLLDSPADDARPPRLKRAADIAGRLRLRDREQLLLHAVVLRAAVKSGLTDAGILGHPAGLDHLKRALEDRWRSLARQTNNRRDRVALVDLANECRPETWL